MIATATVIPSVLGFLLSTTPVPSVTPTPVPAAMATAKARTDHLQFVLPTSTLTPKENVPQHWKDEAREYRKIQKWADEQEHMMRAAQDILNEEADAWDWTAKRKDVDPGVASTSQRMANSNRRYVKQLYELEYLMLNVNVAATNGIKRRHLNPFKDDDPVEATHDIEIGWRDACILLACILAVLALVIPLVKEATAVDDKEAPQK